MKSSGLFTRNLKKQSELLDDLIQKLEAKKLWVEADYRFYDKVTLEIEKNIKSLRKKLQ
jgi:hypothetical protein